jgi:hypothetical protein
MMKSIHLLLLSVFLIPLMQTAYSQSTMNQSGGPIVNQPAGTDNPVNIPGDRLGLIEDTPNYNKFIPNTGPSSGSSLVGPAQPSNNAGGMGGGGGSANTATSGNASNNAGGMGGGGGSANTANPIGETLANTTKTVSETLGKGISSILNPGDISAK